MHSGLIRHPQSLLARQAPARMRRASLHCPWTRSFFTDSFFPPGFYTISCWCFSSWNLELLMIQSQRSYSVYSFTFLILHTSTLPTSSQLSSFPGGLRQGYEAEPYPSQTFTGSCTLWRVRRRLQKGSQREMGTGAIQFMTKDSSESRPDLKKLLKLHCFPKPADWFYTLQILKQSPLTALPTLVSSTLHTHWIPFKCEETPCPEAQTLGFGVADLLFDSIIPVSNIAMCTAVPEIKVCMEKHSFIPFPSERERENIFVLYPLYG